ncbi:unnamed protein product, partial [Didymodactylos carnosus]
MVPPITSRNRDDLIARLEILRAKPQTRQLRSDSQSYRPSTNTSSRITTSSTTSSIRPAPSRLIDLSDSETETASGDHVYSRSILVRQKSPISQKRSAQVRQPYDHSLTSDQQKSSTTSSITHDVEQSIAKHRREIQQLLESAKDRTRMLAPLATNETPTRTNSTYSNSQQQSQSQQYQHKTDDNSSDRKVKKTYKEAPWVTAQFKESWKSLKNLWKQYKHVIKNIFKALLIGTLIGGLLIFLRQKGTGLIPYRKGITCSVENATYCSDMEPMVADVRRHLQIRHGEVDCGFRPISDIRVVKPEIDKYLDQRNYKFELGVQERWKSLIAYIIEKPVDDILVYDKFNNKLNVTHDLTTAFKLSTPEAIRSISCRAKKGVNSALQNIVWLLTGTLGLVSLVWLVKRRSKQQTEEEHTYNGFIQKILYMLEDQYETHVHDSNAKPFLAISHIHDILIPPKDRKRLKSLWERIKAHMSNDESRVRHESQLIHGEEFDVWRWIQPLSPTTKRKDYQRSMHNDSPKSGGSGGNDSYIYMPNDLGLTECLKLRNFFRS